MNTHMTDGLWQIVTLDLCPEHGLVSLIFFKVKFTFEMLTLRGQQHSISTHERMFLWKCQSFGDRECLDLRGTRNPNLWIHAECSNHRLLLLITILWHRQAILESKGDKLSSSAECRIRIQMVSGTESPADWMPADQPTELSRIRLKTWTRQPVLWSARIQPTAVWHSHLFWQYTCLLLISMLWHRQAIFKSPSLLPHAYVIIVLFSLARYMNIYNCVYFFANYISGVK